MELTPQRIIALTISTYWCCVILMSLRSWVKYRVPSGSMPKTRLEKRMWIVWLPTILAWVVLTWQSEAQAEVHGLVRFANWTFALVAVAAFAATIACWIKMGRNWSMAVRPDKDTELITDGMFSNIRHPIYTFSLLLMVCSLLVIKSWGLVIVALLHCSLLIMKAINEERYLTRIHGQSYVQYLRKTNRFLPIKALFVRSGLPSS